MDFEQLTGRYRRLKEELAVAHGQEPFPVGQVERLGLELAATGQAITDLPPQAPRPAAQLVRATRAGPGAPPVLRNRLTPFGSRAAEPAGE